MFFLVWLQILGGDLTMVTGAHNDPVLDKGYYAFTGNYYTSVALFDEMEERKTLPCGTVRSNAPVIVNPEPHHPGI